MEIPTRDRLLEPLQPLTQNLQQNALQLIPQLFYAFRATPYASIHGDTSLLFNQSLWECSQYFNQHTTSNAAFNALLTTFTQHNQLPIHDVVAIACTLLHWREVINDESLKEREARLLPDLLIIILTLYHQKISSPPNQNVSAIHHTYVIAIIHMAIARYKISFAEKIASSPELMPLLCNIVITSLQQKIDLLECGLNHMAISHISLSALNLVFAYMPQPERKNILGSVKYEVLLDSIWLSLESTPCDIDDKPYISQLFLSISQFSTNAQMAYSMRRNTNAIFKHLMFLDNIQLLVFFDLVTALLDTLSIINKIKLILKLLDTSNKELQAAPLYLKIQSHMIDKLIEIASTKDGKRRIRHSGGLHKLQKYCKKEPGNALALKLFETIKPQTPRFFTGTTSSKIKCTQHAIFIPRKRLAVL